MANIRKRGNSYQIRVSCGYDKDGNQVTKSMTWKPEPSMTEKQAEKEVQKQAMLFEERCLKGCTVTSVKFEELAEKWFEEYGKPNLRNYTLDGMRKVTKRVYPAIGHLKVDKITSRHIQQFITDLSVNGKSLRDGNTLARKTVVHHLSFISDVMTFAVKLGMIPDNPCSAVIVPKGKKKEKEIYTIDEVKRLFELSENAPMKYRTFLSLSVYSGFRRAEMLGLEWKDVDFENNIISIRRTSNYTTAYGYFTDTTKTKTSQRSMKFPAHIMELLKDWKAEQAKQAELMGNKWVNTDRLFTKDNGEPMFTGMPYKWLERLCTANNLPFYGIHSLRHFYASTLINANVDVATVSSALGHSAIGTTTNIYLHAFQNANARAGEAIASVLDFTSAKDDKDKSDGEDTAS
ncbi:MAG: site-specific integrase [Ruminiclostridium sp.]|nr:site-specific integrase [Ruminiclostridium sp.]